MSSSFLISQGLSPDSVTRWGMGPRTRWPATIHPRSPAEPARGDCRFRGSDRHRRSIRKLTPSVWLRTWLLLSAPEIKAKDAPVSGMQKPPSRGCGLFLRRRSVFVCGQVYETQSRLVVCTAAPSGHHRRSDVLHHLRRRSDVTTSAATRMSTTTTWMSTALMSAVRLGMTA